MKNFFADDKRTQSLLYFVVILVLLSGCAGLAATNSPLPSATTIPTSTIPAPTVTATSLPTNTPEARVSQPGKYKGYSQPLYDERTSSSQYITMRDGTKLAALIVRPAKDGQTVSTPLPVVWIHDRYHREGIFAWPWLRTLTKYGYILVSVDVRGSGASFGTFRGPFSPEETQRRLRHYRVAGGATLVEWEHWHVWPVLYGHNPIHGSQHGSPPLEGDFPRNGRV